eukprot:TRINITY_DN14827_c0_g1_i1.p1 TRINITY_DN14827_c0_g1~~TRINITY_DN14827_c0_g1_i1.p1  ORF type:complete len:184 (+),score=57.28 TRINITY_DN14827_c0_g1_i1:40-591(+)
MGNKNNVLSKKEVENLSKGSNWTPKELEELHKDFILMDQDKSGELDPKEFKNLLKTRMSLTDEGFQKLFQMMDTDGSGTVSFKELATALSMVGKGTAEDKLKYSFKLYDEDGNGTLDRNEIVNIIEQMKVIASSIGRPGCGDFIESLMQKLDTNGDGEISLDEWVTGGLNTPSLLVLLGIRKV